MTIALANATEIGQFIANMVPYKIMIDGVEERFEKPVVNINGSTYIAVRELCEKLGLSIEWNEKGQEVMINTDKEKNPDNWIVYDEKGEYGQDDSKYGYMDVTGKIQIPAQFDYAREFSEGLAVVGMRYHYEVPPDADTDAPWGEVGYINAKGEYVFENRRTLSDFGDGMAVLNGRYIINKQFEIVLEANYEEVLPFSEGYAAVGITVSTPPTWVDEKWSYIDITGKRATEKEFEEVRNFRGGHAVVKNNGKWGVLDNKFNLVVDYQYDNALVYTYGLLAVEKEGKWGYIDGKGNVIIEFKYDVAKEFQNGLASVCVGDKYGFINTKGEVEIPFEFADAQSFFEGLSKVQEYTKGRGNFGYINTKGEYVIKPIYSKAYAFQNGLARVRSETKEIRYHYINKKGERVDPHN